MASQFSLLSDRRFWPLFVTMFLGAFNDNLMKTAVVVLVAYGVWDTHSLQPEVLVSMAAALFIIPFILFCPFAGELTDKYDKAVIIRGVKIAEIIIAAGAVLAIYLESVGFAFLVLFGLGAQSAFFSPSKYAILPQHLKDTELIGGNGLISTGTYIAILSGTVCGTLLILEPYGPLGVSVILIMASLIGYGASLFIPSAPSYVSSGNIKGPLNLNPFPKLIGGLLSLIRQPHGIFAAMAGVSWFYFVAGTFHAQFPNFARQSLSVDTDVLTFCMVVFSGGIAFGGLLTNRVLKGQIHARCVPWMAVLIGVMALEVYWASLSFHDNLPKAGLVSFADFIGSLPGWRLTIDLFLLSTFGGLYVVPLRAVIQHRVPPDRCARIMAGNALLDAVFILCSALIATALLASGVSVAELFVYLALATFGVAAALFFNKNLHKDFKKE